MVPREKLGMISYLYSIVLYILACRKILVNFLPLKLGDRLICGSVNLRSDLQPDRRWQRRCSLLMVA